MLSEEEGIVMLHLCTKSMLEITAWVLASCCFLPMFIDEIFSALPLLHEELDSMILKDLFQPGIFYDLL